MKLAHVVVAAGAALAARGYAAVLHAEKRRVKGGRSGLAKRAGDASVFAVRGWW